MTKINLTAEQMDKHASVARWAGQKAREQGKTRETDVNFAIIVESILDRYNGETAAALWASWTVGYNG